MIAIDLGHRFGRLAHLGADGHPEVTATEFEAEDGVLEPGRALPALLDSAPGGTGADGAVLGLSVPDGREEELRRAADTAGLRVERVVPEPVAVALHYGAAGEGVDRTLLVCDQGATTLDLSVLAVTPDLTLRVVRTRSHRLGGDGWDAALAARLAGRLPDGADPLRSAALLRRALGDADSVTAEVADAAGELHPVTLDRAQVEAAAAPLRERTLAAVREELLAADPAPDTVLLAGGLFAMAGGSAGIRELSAARGLTVRCDRPEQAVVRGLLALRDFGVLRIASGPAARPTAPHDGYFLPDLDPEPMAPPPETGPRAEPVSPSERGPSSDPDPRSGPEDAPAPTPHPAHASGVRRPLHEERPAGSGPDAGPERGAARGPGAPPAMASPPAAGSAPASATGGDAPTPAPGSGAPTSVPEGDAPAAAAPPRATPHAPGGTTAPGEGGTGQPRPSAAYREPDPHATADPSHPAPGESWHGPPDPPDSAHPAPPGGAPADPHALVAVPVEQLQALRRGDHLLVLWAWPEGALSARVRWRREGTPAGSGPRDGDLVCRRRVYEHDGGLDLTVGRDAVTLTVEALVADPGAACEAAASLVVPAPPALVEYEPTVRRRLTGRVATVTFTSEAGCHLPRLRIVHSRGRFRPTSASEGTVLHEVPGQRLPAGSPLAVEFPLPATRGPSWLVCFPADADAGTDCDLDIRPTALHRLRVT
ncbi:Hsp70 family protein [Streptomyces sp. NPDC007025]|uniref:Hsp70 family protein n=1 Tax=Streptomyces sp. NPDC007025 TaxID=3364771 RepID=UPI00368AD9C4